MRMLFKLKTLSVEMSALRTKYDLLITLGECCKLFPFNFACELLQGGPFTVCITLQLNYAVLAF